MLKILKIILYIITIQHILLGLAGIFFKKYSEFLADIYFNFNLALTSQLNWILNPFAAYVLFVGLCAFFATRKPLGYKNIIYQRDCFFVAACGDMGDGW